MKTISPTMRRFISKDKQYYWVKTFYWRPNTYMVMAQNSFTFCYFCFIVLVAWATLITKISNIILIYSRTQAHSLYWMHACVLCIPYWKHCCYASVHRTRLHNITMFFHPKIFTFELLVFSLNYLYYMMHCVNNGILWGKYTCGFGKSILFIFPPLASFFFRNYILLQKFYY